MASNLLLEHGITPDKENLAIFTVLLKNWPQVREMKAEADFWVHSVNIHDVNPEDRNTKTEKLCIPNEEAKKFDVDAASLYSGDTECEHDVLSDLICQIFHNKAPADRRYLDYLEHMDRPVRTLDSGDLDESETLFSKG
jgi:hypothetical protein